VSEGKFGPGIFSFAKFESFERTLFLWRREPDFPVRVSSVRGSSKKPLPTWQIRSISVKIRVSMTQSQSIMLAVVDASVFRNGTGSALYRKHRLNGMALMIHQCQFIVSVNRSHL